MDEAGVWMTYDELAAVRSIDRQSACCLANRLKLRRQENKHKIIRVNVPPSVAERLGERNVAANGPAAITAEIAAYMSVAAELAGEIKALRGEDHARAACLEAEVLAERNRSDKLAQDLTAEKVACEVAEARVRALEARLARGLWERIQAAIRALKEV